MHHLAPFETAAQVQQKILHLCVESRPLADWNVVDSVMVDATTKTLGNENNDAKQSKWDCLSMFLRKPFYFLANINVRFFYIFFISYLLFIILFIICFIFILCPQLASAKYIDT